jgi:hypothetical protein
MGKHFNSHDLVSQKPGQPAKIVGILAKEREPMFSKVFCQRFFVTGAQSSFFTVNVSTQVQKLVKSRPRGYANVFRALINEQLTAGNEEQDTRAQIYNSQVSKTEVLPWLEMTRWPRYFHGLNMADVAPLAYRVRARNAPIHQNTSIFSASQQYNAMGLQEALLECDTFASKDEIPWTKIAEKHGVVQSTLTRA